MLYVHRVIAVVSAFSPTTNKKVHIMLVKSSPMNKTHFFTVTITGSLSVKIFRGLDLSSV